MKTISFQTDILPLKNELFRLALRITQNRFEAEDVVQETMLKVWKGRSEWDKIDNIEAYCLTVCRNLSLDKMRHMDNQVQNIEQESEPADQSYSANPEEQAVQHDRLQLVRQLISQLPEKQRTCMQLRDVEGKSYRDIANIIGISEEQVKVNIFRARQTIRERFQQAEEGLLERYFAAETSLEEESILRSFFSQENIPADLEQWRALFTSEDVEMLDETFDERMLAMINEEPQTVKAREITLTQRLQPLFKAAAVIAIFLTIGGALQAPWDHNWDTPQDYAAIQQDVDTVGVQPIQADNWGEAVVGDSTQVLNPNQPKN